MNSDLIILLGGSASVLVLLFIFFKNKGHKSVKKSTQSNAQETTQIVQKNAMAKMSVAERYTLSNEELQSHAIRPESNQQRNLDREVGGTEEGKVGSEKENNERVEADIKDVWDDRSEEVDKMGSFNPLTGSSKKSMIWRLKKLRLSKKDREKLQEAAEAYKEHQQTGKFDSQYQQGGFRQMVQTKQDRSHEQDGRGGGAWR